MEIKEIKEELFLKRNYKNVINIVKSDYETEYVIENNRKNELAIYTFKNGKIINVENRNMNTIDTTNMVTKGDTTKIKGMSALFTVSSLGLLYYFRDTLLPLNMIQVAILSILSIVLVSALVWNRITGLNSVKDFLFQSLIKLVLRTIPLLAVIPYMFSDASHWYINLGLILLIYLSTSSNIIELSKLCGLND